MRILLEVLLSAGAMYGVVGGFSFQKKDAEKAGTIAVLNRTIQTLNEDNAILRATIKAKSDTVHYFEGKYKLDEEELKNLKHIVATFDNGRVDTVFYPKPVVDTAALLKIKLEDKKIIDSLKRKTYRDSVLLARRKAEIGVRPIK